MIWEGRTKAALTGKTCSLQYSVNAVTLAWTGLSPFGLRSCSLSFLNFLAHRLMSDLSATKKCDRSTHHVTHAQMHAVIIYYYVVSQYTETCLRLHMYMHAIVELNEC